MYTILSVIFLTLCLVIVLHKPFRRNIKFYVTGLDAGFHFSEIFLLQKLARLCNLEEPAKLFWSIPALTKSITHVIETAKQNGTEHTTKIQNFLSKLYTYRTKTEIEAAKKRGISSTHDLSKGQKLSIILPNKGVFASAIVNNAHSLTIMMPQKKGSIQLDSAQWVGKSVSVYLWRKQDANYVFDTIVQRNGIFRSNPVLYLKHTNTLLRAQKRQTVRGVCVISARLFIVHEKKAGYKEAETGYRCLVEDISESGTLVRIGGKGVCNIQIKLKFLLNNMNVVLEGTIRAVEYNSGLNQSRLHIQCPYIPPLTKNMILSFVYSTLPQNEKDVFDAFAQTEKMKEITEKEQQPDSSIEIPDIVATEEDIPELVSADDSADNIGTEQKGGK